MAKSHREAREESDKLMNDFRDKLVDAGLLDAGSQRIDTYGGAGMGQADSGMVWQYAPGVELRVEFSVTADN